MENASKLEKICLIFLSLHAMLIIIATIVDFICTLSRISQNNFLLMLLQCFSIRKSLKLLLEKPAVGRSPVFDKLRTSFYIIDIVLHTTFRILSWQSIIGLSFREKWPEGELGSTLLGWAVQPLLNTWYLEGFIILGGITWLMGIWKRTTEKSPVCTYTFSIVTKILKHFFPLLILTCLEFSLPFHGSGPAYESFITSRSKRCTTTFIYSLFYLSNLVPNPEATCETFTWSMSVEIQLFSIACLVMFIYKRNPKAGLFLNISLLALGTWLLFHVFHTNEIPPQISITKHGNPREYIEKYYSKLSGHLWSYMLSLLAVRYLFSEERERIQMIAKRSSRMVYSILILQLFSTGLWNVWDLPPNRFWIAIYVVNYHYIGAIYWMTIIFLKIGTSAELFMPLDVRPSRHNPVSKVAWEENNDGKSAGDCGGLNLPEDNNDEINLRLDEENLSIDWYHLLSIMLRILRGTYFAHGPFLWWHLFKRRNNLPSELFSYVLSLGGIAVGCIYSGVAFYFFALGPLESFLLFIRKRQGLIRERQGKKHQS